jgi:hypothetical protein
MKQKFILLLSIPLFGLLHIDNAQAAGPLPSSPFPTQITSANGGGCIDAPLPQPANAEGGGVWFLQQFPCNGGINQHWSFQPTSPGKVVIHSTFNPRFCLDLPGAATAPNTRIQLFPCHGGPDQQWMLTQTDGNTGEISPVLAPGMVVDVANGIVREQAVIQLFPRQGSVNQRWRFPVDGLPQGLTGGIAHVNHDCGPNAAAFASVGLTALGIIACGSLVFTGVDWGAAGNCAQVVQGASGTVASAPGTNFKQCGDPSVFRSGAVLAPTGTRVPTLLLDPSGSSFSVQAADGWVTMSDGDIGNSANFGFYHQELREVGGGVSDLSVSDRLKLPRGAACGFHHTRNTPFDPQTAFRSGKASTCMGLDPASRACPQGWIAKNHFDMSSGDGQAPCQDLANQSHCAYFVWCEYQDPFGLCNDSQCLNDARRAGAGLAVASDTDPSGSSTLILDPPTNDAPCPLGWARTNVYDDGRPAGAGLSWCWPLIEDLPQGLTAGVAYLVRGEAFFIGGKALGAATPANNGDGFAVRSDGDWGRHADDGFYHQELVSGGVTDQSSSDRFKLLPGTACGFHHTRNTPGLTCMGVDPANSCPNGWIQRRHFDMSSDFGHFVWCEYQDPNRLCSDPLNPATSECDYNARYIGYVTSFSSNTDSDGTAVANGGCSVGWTRTAFFDAGRSSGQGLSWCMP